MIQGAFRKVAAEAGACAKGLTALLRGRLQRQEGDAAECVRLMRALGEPIDTLQVKPWRWDRRRSTGSLLDSEGMLELSVHFFIPHIVLVRLHLCLS